MIKMIEEARRRFKVKTDTEEAIQKALQKAIEDRIGRAYAIPYFAVCSDMPSLTGSLRPTEKLLSRRSRTMGQAFSAAQK
jgi:hypothetical protein